MSDVAHPYRPSPETLEQIKDVDFIAVVGPTAVGKSTLIEAAIAEDPSLHLVVTTTSRGSRPGEQDGVHMHFRSQQSMESQAAGGEFVQLAPPVFGSWYATRPEDYGTGGRAIMPVIVEALADFQRLPFKSLRQIIVLPPDAATWRQRLVGNSRRNNYKSALLKPGHHYSMLPRMMTSAL